MASENQLDEIMNMGKQLRDMSTIAGRNVRGLLGIAEWIEESGHPRKAEAVRVMAHQLDEVVGELSGLVEDVP